MWTGNTEDRVSPPATYHIHVTCGKKYNTEAILPRDDHVVNNPRENPAHLGYGSGYVQIQ